MPQQGPQLDPVIMGTALKELGVDPDTIQKAIELTLQAEQSSQDQIMAEHGGQAPPPSAGQ